ncbi:MAG TPA: hypothetical protein VIY48_11910 [Candidatus Paceibacterota bacterium]
MPTLPPLVIGEAGQGLLIAPAKKLIIRALRATFTSLYPNTKLASMNIDLEYPYLEEHYPGIWVKFSPHKIQASGLDPARSTAEEIFSVWYFEGTVTLMVFALSSKERDLISDGFIEAYAFGKLMPSASVFYSTLLSSDLINMTPQSDVLSAGGQTESVGVPWDDDKLAYEDRYSFEVVGQIRSRIQSSVVFTNLSEIQVGSTLTNVDGAPNNSTGNDGNGVWQ